MQTKIAKGRAELLAAVEHGVPGFAADFFTLGSDEVRAVLSAADAAKYRKPKDANGSRARYYYARLQRIAAINGSAK